jgi:regulator of protease activity HflC (stomatin/prohibitin superfamily)
VAGIAALTPWPSQKISFRRRYFAIHSQVSKNMPRSFLTPSLPSSLGSKITCRANFSRMTGIESIVGAGFGLMAYVLLRALMLGFFTVAPNERAVLTSFGKAQRIAGVSTLDTPLAEDLPASDRDRYRYPQLQVIGPGGPYFRWPWQQVHKVNVAISTASIAFDPETPQANQGGQVLEAVTQDQLNIGVTGQIRFNVSEGNLYAFLFGVKNPIAHVMGYFISILRERIANFKAPGADGPANQGELRFEGISINDLRKNANLLNEQMDRECRSSAARYGIVLDASLITGIDPPQQIESALAAISTAHNEVSSDISVAQALADQRIEESKRAVEIRTMKAEAEVEPLKWLAEQLRLLKQSGPDAVPGYLRNVRLDLYKRARRIVLDCGK